MMLQGKDHPHYHHHPQHSGTRSILAKIRRLLLRHPRRRLLLLVVCVCILLSLCTIVVWHWYYDDDTNNSAATAPAPHGIVSSAIYKGTPWWNKERTLSVQTIGETKFARCDLHTVKVGDDNNDNNKNTMQVIDDWLFLEEMNAVNVAVMMSGDDGDIGRNGDGIEQQQQQQQEQQHERRRMVFPVFEQHKYAIPGTTLSPVGGFIDENESPWDCAKREVFEELGVGSKTTHQQLQAILLQNTANQAAHHTTANNAAVHTTDTTDRIRNAYTLLPNSKRRMDEYNLAIGDVINTDTAADHEDADHEVDPDWIYLGRYRSAANRGAGFIYTYLLKNAVPLLPNGGTAAYTLSTGDDEAQRIKVFTHDELQTAVFQGRFQEVKWTTTYALSLLHLNNNPP